MQYKKQNAEAKLRIIMKKEDLQRILNDFARSATRYGLTISINKTEVMYQPKPGSPSHDPVIGIGDEQLKVVQKFCYLGGFLSQNACIDDEITARIGKASASFGRLQHRLGQIMLSVSKHF